MKQRSRLVRILFGAGLGCAAFLGTLGLSGVFRSPYVTAFAAVVVSFWLLEAAGAFAAAIVSIVLINCFLFTAHPVTLPLTPAGEGARAVIFLCISLGVGLVMRRMAKESAQQARLAAERQIALMDAEQQRTLEQQQLKDLARENEVRIELALEGADIGVWEWNLETNASRWSPGFYRLHKLERNNNSGYEIWRSLVEPEDLPRVEREIQHALGAGEPFACEYRVARTDASDDVRWIAIEST